MGGGFTCAEARPPPAPATRTSRPREADAETIKALDKRRRRPSTLRRLFHGGGSIRCGDDGWRRRRCRRRPLSANQPKHECHTSYGRSLHHPALFSSDLGMATSP